MATLTNLKDVKRSLAVGSNTTGTLVFDKNLDDILLNDLITQATDMFVKETGVDYFGVEGTLTLDLTHRYVVGRKLFFRDDMVSVTSIENDGNGTLTSADWVTMPRDSEDGVYGVELRKLFWRWTDTRFASIKVIGVKGRSANGQPPEQVHLAVTRLASWLYQTRDSRGSIQFGDKVTNFPQDAPKLVQRIANNEKHSRIYT